MRSLTPLLLGALLVAPALASAQERTAGSNLSQEASWNALKSLISKTDGDVQVTRVDVNALKAQMKSVTDCARTGALWNGSVCVPTRFKLQNHSYYGSGDWGGAGTVAAGWHTFCTLAFHHDRTNHWLNITAGPNADGKFYWTASRAFPGDMGTSEPRILCVD